MKYYNSYSKLSIKQKYKINVCIFIFYNIIILDNIIPYSPCIMKCDNKLIETSDDYLRLA